MHLKISSAKWQPFCPGGDELTSQVCSDILKWLDQQQLPQTIWHIYEVDLLQKIVIQEHLLMKVIWNSNIIMWGNEIEIMGCKMSAILFQPQCVNSLWPSDAIKWHRHRSTFTDSTRPLSEPMLPTDQWCSMTNTWDSVHQWYLSHQLLKLTWQLTCLKFHSNLQGANELIALQLNRGISKPAEDKLKSILFNEKKPA